jgi:hypothetical protein
MLITNFIVLLFLVAGGALFSPAQAEPQHIVDHVDLIVIDSQTESKQRCLANNLTFDSCLKAKTYRGGPRGVAVDNLSAALVNAILALAVVKKNYWIASRVTTV